MSRAEPEGAQPRFDPAAVFSALGDETRLAMLKQLSDGRARSISALSADTSLARHVTRQALTKHLQVLETAGLVRSVRAGRERRFAYRPEAVMSAQTYLDRVSGQWDEALERLRALVED